MGARRQSPIPECRQHAQRIGSHPGLDHVPNRALQQLRPARAAPLAAGPRRVRTIMRSSTLDGQRGMIRMLMQRLRCNADGVAAVEFAMIAPIMFFLFVGSVEFSQAITVDRRVTQVASSTADLIAREKSTTTADLAGVMQIIDHLVRPYDP